jgi:hypothetical protein
LPELRDDILPEEVERMAFEGCPTKDIADFYSCHPSTIRERFRENLTKGRARRRAVLREYQWEAARKGNVTMQIWLGKQHLGQSDQGERDDREEVEYDDQ